MPGRLAIFDDGSFKSDVIDTLGPFKDEVGQLLPKYNIAPTIDIPVLLNTRKYTLCYFGLIPSWAKDKKSININARSETIYEKMSFRESFKSKRCLILVNGYYEWLKEDKRSTPYLMKPTKDNYFAFAGVYDEWFDISTGRALRGIALITTQPNDTVEKIHDRMPVILDKKDWKVWLDSKDLVQVNNLLKTCSNELITYHEVSSLVNSVANDEVGCIVEHVSTTYSQGSLF